MTRIRLASLELEGFKSFADPVRLEFPGEVNAIVGPNGVGKSNVVDAILWVLGEQSPNLLRLKTMGDVVFSGNQRRKPAGAAEVAIALTADDGRWEATGGRLVLSRRVYRNGPSEYRVNGKSARLKDLMDELLSIGLGTRGYSIIGQDRIGRVLSARPTDRRVLLEEAAGITRYRVRKHEAELKLEQTRQNLARLDDVIAEVDRSLRQLKRQAGQARRFAKIEEELHRHQRELFTLLARNLTARRDEIARRRAQVETEVAGAASALGGAEADLAAARKELEAARARVEERRAEVGRLAASRERLEAFLERSADLVDNLRESLEANRRQVAGLRSAAASLEDDQGQAARRVSHLEEALEEVARRRTEAARSLEKARAAQAEAERAAAEARQDLLRTISTVTSRRNQQVEMARQHDRLSYTLGQLDHEEERLGRRRGELAEQFEAARTESAAAAARLEEARRRRDEAAAGRQSAAEAAAAAAREAEAVAHRLWEIRHRLTGIDGELARFHAAVEQVAQLIPESALAGQLSDYLSPAPGAAELLDRVWKEWLELPVARLDALPPGSLAAASTLEARARIVLMGEAPAAGGPTALPTVPAPDGAEPLLPLAGIPEEHAPWILRVLPPAFTCQDAAVAARLAEEHPHALFLTAEGALLRGRTHELPTAGSRTRGALALRDERERLAADAERLEREEAGHRHRQAQLQEEAAALERDVDRSRQELVEAEQAHARAAAREQSLDGELKRLERELEAVRADRVRAAREKEELESRRGRLAGEVQELEERLEDLERAVENAAAQVESRRSASNEAQRELDRWKAEERLATERLATARAEAERLAARRREIEDRLRTLSAEAASLAERLKTTEEEIVRSRTRLVEEQGLLHAAREQERQQAEAVEAVAQQVTRLEREVAERRTAHDQVRTRRHELEVEATRLDAETAALEESANAELGLGVEVLAREEVEAGADPEELRATVEQLRARLDKMGPVNLLAVQELEELTQRSTFLHEQREDLVESLRSLNATIREIDATCLERFMETFQQVNAVLAETFAYLFGGGTARLDLADEDDPLESGVLITAQPPGKKNQSVQLLSGGEKALVGLSLLIALFRIKPSPFCILDEVDAALDDANVERLGELVRDMTDHTQFVLITHNRRTMTRADILYGVTMEEPGVSKIVSVRMED